MSIWHKSMYGVGKGFSYDVGDPVAPIGPDLQEQDDWWFRGRPWRAKKPQDEAVMVLPAGGKVDVEIACHVAWTSLGERTTDLRDDLAACPDNYGAFHSGDPAGPIEENLLSGCALGIADVDDIEDVTMDNLAIFSVNHRCVRDRVTSFEIPERMPACTGEKCICAWFWLANNGTANFYMTGFDCSVSGAPADARRVAPPQDPVFCGDEPSSCTTGSKRPLYAYNQPNNIPWWDNNHRPGYHASWSFPNDGAQNDIFEASEVDGVEVNRTSTISLDPADNTTAGTSLPIALTRPLSTASSATILLPTASFPVSLPPPSTASGHESLASISLTRSDIRSTRLEYPSTRLSSSPSSAADKVPMYHRRPWRSRHGHASYGRAWRWRHRSAALPTATPDASPGLPAVEATETGSARIVKRLIRRDE
ncbi:hypothetical protein JCM11251_001749 [Rhodosporidiobolus azoricus]